MDALASSSRQRRAVARIDLEAIAANCRLLRGRLEGGAQLCAVVKADGYGHGALPAAQAALAGGASMLAVVSAAEAQQLRDGGLTETPLLVMGALSTPELQQALAVGAQVALWRPQALDRICEAGGGKVHIKFDSGMGRLGTADAGLALELAERAASEPNVQLAGLMTHFATADVLDDDGFFVHQLEQFNNLASAVRRVQPQLCVHAANSAALMRSRAAHFDMARCGIAIYGLDPFGSDAQAHELQPALTLSSYVALVKRLQPGQSTGYGRRFIAAQPTWIGLLPIGYADGFRRVLSGRAQVLVDGRRVRQVGTVSMDSIAVELGHDPACEQLLGAEAKIIGTQGKERISAEELAGWAGTINYEITCGLGARVERDFTGAQ